MRIPRLHLFEVLVLTNLLAIGLIAPGVVFRYLPQSLYTLMPGMFLAIALGILVRLAAAWFSGHRSEYLAVIRERRWQADTFRVGLGYVLLTHTYGWIKLLVPIERPHLEDAALWAFTKRLFGGYSPEVFLLTLFSNRHFLRFIDWTYANIFFASLVGVIAFFFSSPDGRLRIAFMNSQAILWLAGGWLYMLVPTLGPAYAFPDLWLVYADSLRTTQHLQALLMRNYQNVIRLSHGIPSDVQMVFGIAAFPSLHVAYQTLVALWMRRVSVYGRLVFGLCAFFVFIGSMITGWHYLVDGLAGSVLAVIAYRGSLMWMRFREDRAERM